MEERDIAWLAGLFDGEGCVWSRWPKRKNVHVEIKMTHQGTIEHIQALFPGRMVEGHLSGLSIKRQWRWSLDTNGSRRFLMTVVPYLVTKRDEAILAIRLCDRSGTEDLDALARQLKKLRA